jgi:hypothetical protein
MGLFVQTNPKPEVTRINPKLLLSGDYVGGDE